MKGKLKRVISLLLVFSMLIGLYPANMNTANAEPLAPVTNNGVTTFAYQGTADNKTVNLAGNFNGWDASSISLTKDANNVFTTDQNLKPGSYEYKFIIDGAWMDGDNLTYVVEGLILNSGNDVKVGNSLDLSAQVLNADGTLTDVQANYSLESSVNGVSIESNKLVVADTAQAGKVTVNAEYNGMTASKEITIQSTMYSFTVNYKREDGQQMNWDMWVFGNGLDGSAKAFTEEVDGYAKATFQVPINEVTIITRPGDWSSQEMNRIVTIPDGQTSVEVWLNSGDETTYYSKPGVTDPSQPVLGRQIQFNYNRPAGDYDGWNLWYWSTGLTDANDGVPVEELDYFVNGRLNLPISKGATNIGFILRNTVDTDNRWAEKDPNKDLDRTVVTDPTALERTTKVFLEQGKDEFRQVPYLKGPENIDGNIAFYYRDIDLYEADQMDTIDAVKINIVKRNLDTKATEKLGSFDMTYSTDNQRFEYTLQTPESGFDYVYTFDVTKNGATETGLLDVSNTVNGESYQRLVSLNIDVTASLNMTEAKAGDAVVATIDIVNPDNHAIKEVYIDATSLNQGKIIVPTDLLVQNLALPLDLAAGEKILDVVVVDEFDGQHKTTLTLNTLASTDTDQTIAWDEEIIYFMLTDRFFDGNAANNDPNNDGSYDPNHLEAYHGGDFQGIIDKVDYLKQLGVTTVWITPIVDNIDTNQMANSGDKQYGYHGYWAKDFTKIEPRLGDVATMKNMIDVLHENGIKVMVDVVLNHSGYGTNNDPAFSGMLRTNPGSDDRTSELSGLPDFITEDPTVSKKLVEWQSEWLNTLRTDSGNTIDYFRIDTVKHVEPDTWKEFKTKLTEIKPDFKMIGEYYGASAGNDGGYLGNGMMDSLLDFEFKSLAEKFIKGDIANVEARLTERNAAITSSRELGQFLSSHDEDGFLATRAGGNQDLVKVAASLQMTAKGQPVIYYGEEIGTSGRHSDFSVGRYNENRQSFDWSKVDDNPLLTHYQKITNIRKDYASLFARGDRKTVYTDDSVSVFTRNYDGKTIFVALNISDTEKKVSFDLDPAIADSLKDIFNADAVYNAENGKIEITVPANKDGGTAVLLPSINNTTKVIFNFEDPDNGEWEMYVWSKAGDGARYPFTRQEGNVKIAEVELPGNVEEIGFIVKGSNGPDDWRKNFDGDRFVTITKNPQNVYIKSGVEEFETDGLLMPKIEAFTIEAFRQAKVTLSVTTDLADVRDDFDVTIDGVSIKDKVASIEAVSGTDSATSQFVINFTEDLPINKNLEFTFTKTMTNDDGKTTDYSLAKTSRLDGIFDSKEFADRYGYDGELGAIYNKLGTEFRVWAPTAEKVDLVVFDDQYGEIFKTYSMVRNDQGVYEYSLPGDQLGKAYMFDVDVNGSVNRVVDPYAKSVTVNGQRGVVVNPQASDVDRIQGDDAKNPIIYELHVRDLSIDENSGITNKGKFSGLTETGTKTPTGQITGLDYIKSLGVTHVQLIPIYDFSKYSVDETKLDTPQFNWGYDPVNYNSIEGSYSTDPYDPFKRIEELQTTVDTLHKNGLGVIMDVVYNHVAGVDQHSFEKIVPGYYYRQDAAGNYLGGTGVGNETASERTMMRKFIVDSITYLARTYKFDGFRFDLMGTHDYETLNIVHEKLKEINPNIFILGEGWNMDMGIPEDMRATQKNAAKMDQEIAFFSDDMRDGVKGSVFDEKDPGFVNGKADVEDYVYQNIKGANGLQGYTSARQLIQYVEAHDNLTLWDKLEKSNPDDSETDRLKMHKMATTIVMFAQGTPFIHAGQEFARTKYGDHNSYKSPDEINKIDWARVETYADNVDYFREIVKIRKDYPEFDVKDYAAIDAMYQEIATADNLIAYKVAGDLQDLFIGYNSSREEKTIEIPNGKYTILVRDQKANAEGLETIEVTDGKISIAPLSSLVLKQVKQATITFDLNGGNFNGNTANVVKLVDKGTEITIIDAPVRDGYIFDYWKGSEYQPGDKYLVTEDHTFVAQWLLLPIGLDREVEKGAKVNAKDFIKNADQFPEGTKFEWTIQPDTSKLGTIEAGVKITYPNGQEMIQRVFITVKEVGTVVVTDGESSQETIAESQTETDGEKTVVVENKGENPKTGDQGIVLFAGLALISIAAIYIISRKKKQVNK